MIVAKERFIFVDGVSSDAPVKLTQLERDKKRKKRKNQKISKRVQRKTPNPVVIPKKQHFKHEDIKRKQFVKKYF